MVHSFSLESGYCCIGCPLWQSLGTTLVNIGTLFLFVPTLHSFVTSTFIVYLVWRFCFSFYDVKVNLGLVAPSTNFSYSLLQTFPFSFSTHNDFSFDSSFRRSQSRVLDSGSRQLFIAPLLTLRTIQRSHLFLSFSIYFFVCELLRIVNHSPSSSFTLTLFGLHLLCSCVDFVFWKFSSRHLFQVIDVTLFFILLWSTPFLLSSGFFPCSCTLCCCCCTSFHTHFHAF